jgi:hypothetical protein
MTSGKVAKSMRIVHRPSVTIVYRLGEVPSVTVDPNAVNGTPLHVPFTAE